jgi:hypothetical protein
MILRVEFERRYYPRGGWRCAVTTEAVTVCDSGRWWWLAFWRAWRGAKRTVRLKEPVR